MAQEFHVMRPKLYYNGKFKRAIQKIPGLEDGAKVIGGKQLPDEDAIEIEKKVLNLVQKYSGMQFQFQDDKVYKSIQFNFSKWHHVRSFMAYHDYPFTKFLFFGRHRYQQPFLPERSPAIIQSIESGKSSFPNMVFSKDNNGYFFPCKIKMPIETKWGNIGSSIGLKDEIARLPALMEYEGYWHSDIDEFIEDFSVMCDESIKNCHPIIIDG